MLCVEVKFECVVGVDILVVVVFVWIVLVGIEIIIK